MRDYKRLFSGKMKEEFLGRWESLSQGLESQGDGDGLQGLEGLDGMSLDRDSVSDTMTALAEGTAGSIDDGLEAIVLRFGRPAYFVKDNSFDTDLAPSASAEVNRVVNQARAVIESAIPSVGRIELRNHRKDWVGTGWLIAPNIVVTNRHVAAEFAFAQDDGFALTTGYEGRPTRASIDLRREHGVGEESIFRVRNVLWIEPGSAGHHDVAFLEVRAEGEEAQAQPVPIDLLSDEEFKTLQPDHWLAVIGYPAFSIYNHRQDQQRIFEGVFNVKRLQPGLLTSVSDGKLCHDATTLGGNSGSVVLDLESGKAAALHFGGYEGNTNFAVPAPVIRSLLAAHAA